MIKQDARICILTKMSIVHVYTVYFIIIYFQNGWYNPATGQRPTQGTYPSSRRKSSQ